jgi:hypothetical protein
VITRSLPFVLSGFAVALAVYVVLRDPAASGPARASDDRALRAEVARLRSEVQFLAGALARSSRAPAAADVRATDGAPQPDSAPAAPERTAAAVTRVEAPAGITVKLDEHGVPAVQNRDPALVGQAIVVQVHRADGSLEPMPITVPPVAP